MRFDCIRNSQIKIFMKTLERLRVFCFALVSALNTNQESCKWMKMWVRVLPKVLNKEVIRLDEGLLLKSSKTCNGSCGFESHRFLKDIWKIVRVVYCASLLKRWSRNGPTGSNPVSSAGKNWKYGIR